MKNETIGIISLDMIVVDVYKNSWGNVVRGYTKNNAGFNIMLDAIVFAKNEDAIKMSGILKRKDEVRCVLDLIEQNKKDAKVVNNAVQRFSVIDLIKTNVESEKIAGEPQTAHNIYESPSTEYDNDDWAKLDL